MNFLCTGCPVARLQSSAAVVWIIWKSAWPAR